MINLVIMSKSLNSIYTFNYDPKEHFLHGVIAIPARRALEKEKIDSLEKLSDYSEKEIMQMHGFGKNTMEKLKNHMKENQMFFKEI
ncbi:ERCC4-type nuclease [Chryseobacterium rhizosphaerae]|nr:ERCC4-type nuclease [Chryseobacterium rhizosphaerae]SMC99961.1 RNA polymerase, alpha chain C terminal domain [Chryseobacterium sp. YR221]